MANQLPTFLRGAGILGAGAVTAATAPITTAVALGAGLTLVAILALTGALARHRTRREAAYRVLALLLKVLTTEQAATRDLGVSQRAEDRSATLSHNSGNPSLRTLWHNGRRGRQVNSRQRSCPTDPACDHGGVGRPCCGSCRLS